MLKPLIEFVLLAVMVGTAQGSATVPREVQDQTLRRLPVVVRATASRAPTLPSAGLPPVGDRRAWPKLSDPTSLGVLVTAGSAIVIDRTNGKVLFEKDADRVRPIASITKLMAALVFLEGAPDLSSFVTITEQDIGDGVSTVFALGDTVTLRDLFSAALIGSANDAARALVRSTDLDEPTFARLMNAKARALGMTNTRFMESTGLSPENVSTARELTVLVRAASEVPLISETVRESVYRANGSAKKSQFVKNTNLLLDGFLNKPPYKIALGKTGSLNEAGYCFVASVDEDNHGVIAVALGSETHFSRFEDMKALVYWALSKWQWPEE